ncbi:MAG: putative porin, partial [Hyphomicrobiales bacterium]|nr:putative porin [Hyphomicrobiales bacterium]
MAPLAPSFAAGEPPAGASAPSNPATAPSAPTPGAVAPVDPVQSLEQLRSTLLNLMRALVETKTLTPEKAQALLRESGIDPALLGAAVPAPPAAAPQAQEPSPPVVKVPYVPQTVRDQIRDDVKQEVLAQARAERWGEPGALPEWLNRFTLYGDVKVRFQSDRYDSSNDLVQIIDAAFGQPQGNTLNSTEARDRFRVRARFGIDAKASETVQAGVRIVTNGPNEDQYNPTSEYFDLGQYGQRFGAQVDLAYIRWNALPWLSWTSGRVANPYVGTDLVWAQDFTFDGTNVRLRPRLTESWSSTTTLGAYYLESTSSAPGVSSNNAWMYAAQTGADA